MGNNDFKKGTKPEQTDQQDALKHGYTDPFSDIIQSILSTEQEESTAPAAQQPADAESDDKSKEDVSAVTSDTLDLGKLPALETYQDAGEYRSFDGNREYRSFDATLPDASPEEWYHFSEEDRELDEPEDALKTTETSTDATVAENDEDDDEPKVRFRGLKILAHVLLVLFTALSVVYLVAIYSSHPFIVKARTTYIQTAMMTMSHKWLATAIIPPDVIEDVMRMKYEMEESKAGIQSNWGAVEIQELPSFSPETIESVAEPEAPVEDVPEETAVPSEEPGTVHEETDVLYSSPEEETFFTMFWELDYRSVLDYMEEHPEALAEGWSKVNINEAGLDDAGTTIQTIYGHQVLAIDAQQGIVLVRIYPDKSRGIMAICKDTSRVAHCAADTVGTVGQYSGEICEENDGILSISGAAFWNDEDGNGNGGQISGLAVCNSLSYGNQLMGSYKRIELREDGKMYIVDSFANLGPGTRDACEFMPAMIIDGEIMLAVDAWDGIQPRTTLGQTKRLETLMVIVEGRSTENPGCTVRSIAEIMQQYGCVQALNLDGGTSSIMYYKGEYITKCSNENLPNGRAMPTAWVYKENK